MASLNIADLTSLTIGVGSSESNAISLTDDAYAIGIAAPAIVTASAVTVMVAASSGSSATFVTLQSGGADIQLPANKGLIMTPFPWRQLKVASSAAGGEAQADTFLVTKVVIV